MEFARLCCCISFFCGGLSIQLKLTFHAPQQQKEGNSWKIPSGNTWSQLPNSPCRRSRGSCFSFVTVMNVNNPLISVSDQSSTPLCWNTLFWDVDMRFLWSINMFNSTCNLTYHIWDTCTLQASWWSICRSGSLRGRSTKCSFSALVHYAITILEGGRGGLCWSSIGCRRDRITANYCPNQPNLQQFVPTVYYVTRAAEVGRACDGSVLCVCLWRYMLDQWEVCY